MWKISLEGLQMLSHRQTVSLSSLSFSLALFFLVKYIGQISTEVVVSCWIIDDHCIHFTFFKKNITNRNILTLYITREFSSLNVHAILLVSFKCYIIWMSKETMYLIMICERCVMEDTHMDDTMIYVSH